MAGLTNSNTDEANSIKAVAAGFGNKNIHSLLLTYYYYY